MGYGDLNTFLDYPETECVALCDVDDEWLNKRLPTLRRKQGKSNLTYIRTGERVIDNKDVDVVIIGTPDIGIASDGLGLPSGKRRICREAALQYDRGMQPDGKSRP